MRIILPVIAVAAVGSAAFAIGELRALTHAPTSQPVAQVVSPRAVETIEEREPPRTVPLSTARPLSNARGPLPFGGVPRIEDSRDEPENDVDDSESIPDSIDRCPDDPEEGADDDGCPEVERIIEREDGRTIILKSSIIIY